MKGKTQTHAVSCADVDTSEGAAARKGLIRTMVNEDWRLIAVAAVGQYATRHDLYFERACPYNGCGSRLAGCQYCGQGPSYGPSDQCCRPGSTPCECDLAGGERCQWGRAVPGQRGGVCRHVTP